MGKATVLVQKMLQLLHYQFKPVGLRRVHMNERFFGTLYQVLSERYFTKCGELDEIQKLNVLQSNTIIGQMMNSEYNRLKKEIDQLDDSLNTLKDIFEAKLPFGIQVSLNEYMSVCMLVAQNPKEKSGMICVEDLEKRFASFGFFISNGVDAALRMQYEDAKKEVSNAEEKLKKVEKLLDEWGLAIPVYKENDAEETPSGESQLEDPLEAAEREFKKKKKQDAAEHGKQASSETGKKGEGIYVFNNARLEKKVGTAGADKHEKALSKGSQLEDPFATATLDVEKPLEDKDKQENPSETGGTQHSNKASRKASRKWKKKKRGNDGNNGATKDTEKKEETGKKGPFAPAQARFPEETFFTT